MSALVHEPRLDAVYSVAGSFGPAAASEVQAWLAELPPEACAVLDFSLAAQVSDLALAVLARALEAPRHPHVALRGLTVHHERMLRYLGVDRTFLDAPSADAPLA